MVVEKGGGVVEEGGGVVEEGGVVVEKMEWWLRGWSGG